jgi:hypothetical protein
MQQNYKFPKRKFGARKEKRLLQAILFALPIQKCFLPLSIHTASALAAVLQIMTMVASLVLSMMLFTDYLSSNTFVSPACGIFTAGVFTTSGSTTVFVLVVCLVHALALLVIGVMGIGVIILFYARKGSSTTTAVESSCM